MRRVIFTAVVALVAVLGIATPTGAAARPSTGSVVYTIDKGTSLAGQYTDSVLPIWNNSRTGVVLVTGACSGPRCIHLDDAGTMDTRILCSDALGCTVVNADGSATVTVAYDAGSYGGFDGAVDIQAREVGHAVILGQGGPYYWASNVRDLMSRVYNYGDGVKRITKETRDYVASLI